MKTSGYQHPAYAQTFKEVGDAVYLKRSGGSLIRRSIPGTSLYDAIGCYPLFSCNNWEGLEQDLDEVCRGLVSIVVISDPFGGYNEALLRRCFPDLSKPYKAHFVVDLSKPLEKIVCSHHKRNVRKAQKRCEIELCAEPVRYLDDWVLLYDNLIKKHGIYGISAFSRESFGLQLKIPGLVAFRAFFGGETLGMVLWIVQGDVVYYHLGAYSESGYLDNVSFALFWQALHFFAGQGMNWVNLGAGAGIIGNEHDGLSRFKKGWSTDTKATYLCGKVCDSAAYKALTEGVVAEYFPAYRSEA